MRCIRFFLSCVLTFSLCLLTSMDGDGTKEGYDIDLTRAISSAVRIPVIASGGAGHADHFVQALTEGGAAAVSGISSQATATTSVAITLRIDRREVIRRTYRGEARRACSDAHGAHVLPAPVFAHDSTVKIPPLRRPHEHLGFLYFTCIKPSQAVSDKGQRYREARLSLHRREEGRKGGSSNARIK